MPFCIQVGESAGAALQRLLPERARRASRGLDGHPDDLAIHQTRRELKRLQAVLELVRSRIRRKDHRRWRRRLDRCSRALAPARDARALVQSLSLIPVETRASISSRSWTGLMRRLRREAVIRVRDLHRRRLARSVKGGLQELAQEFRARRWSPPGGSRVDAGIRRAYRRGRRSLRRVEVDPSARNHHRWRRHAKRLGYQLALLQPEGSRSLAGWAWGLDRLGIHLGQHHDLFLLQEFVRRGRWDAMPASDRGRLLRRIRDRRREIAQDVAALGKRLFLLPPRDFVAAVHRHRQGRESRSRALQEDRIEESASDSWTGLGRPMGLSNSDDLTEGDTAVGDGAGASQRVEELGRGGQAQQVKQGRRKVPRTDRS